MSNSTRSMLRMEDVSVRFGDIPVLSGFSLDVRAGEFVAIVGPSGCGKTTLLNLFSGFLSPSAGKVDREGRTRTVYQSNGLYPWLTVEENVGLGLRALKDGHDRETRVGEMLGLVGLERFRYHYPHQLSGGMRQRAELGRALVSGTDILLLDEPFSSLDYLTRHHLRQELTRMLEDRPRTVILVTHDIEEAVQLADRILVLSDRPARILSELQPGIPRPRDPGHPFVAQTVQEILAEFGIINTPMED